MNENKNILQSLASGELPEVKFSVSIDNDSILRLSIAVLIVSVIVLLSSQLIHKHN